MKILPNGIAVIEGDQDTSAMVEKHGRLDYDRELLDRVLPFIRPGDDVIDIGANIGCHTKAYLDRVGEDGNVLAIEPSKLAYECLTHNCDDAARGMIALSNGESVGYIKVDKEKSGSSYVGFLDGDSGVLLAPLDAVLAWFEWDFSPKFIKVDVEGMEPLVLDGAIETISKYRPIMLIEINNETLPRYNFKPQDVYDRLDKLGYVYQPIQPDCNLNSYYFDLICVPK